LIITDVNEKILYVNELVEKVTGYSTQEIVGQTPALWGRQMPDKFYEEMENIIRHEKRSLVTKVINKHKSGKLYDAILRISPVIGTSGKIKFFVGMETVIDRGVKDKLNIGLIPFGFL